MTIKMKRIFWIFWLFSISNVFLYPQQKLALQNTVDSVSYAMGIIWANDCKTNQLNVSINAFCSGVIYALKNDTTIIPFKKAFELLDNKGEQLRNKNTDSSTIDSLSYVLGYIWTYKLISTGITEMNPLLLKWGMNNYYSNVQHIFDVDGAKKYVYNYIESKREEEFRGIKLYNANWLIENARNDNVIVVDNGVRYKVIKSSANDSLPQPTSIFELKYTARLIDGTVFYQTNGVEKYYLSGLIPGLHNILLSMKKGEIREVYIPYNQAFGSGGIKNQVPPFATVIYYIELVNFY